MKCGRAGGAGERDELRNNRLLLCCEGARLLVLHSRSKAPERREGGGGCRCRAHCERWMQRTQRLLLLPYKRCQPKLGTMSERGHIINPNYGSSFLFVCVGGGGGGGVGGDAGGEGFFFFFLLGGSHGEKGVFFSYSSVGCTYVVVWDPCICH